MSDDTAARVRAQEGLRHIEQAILMLLDAHPNGLRSSIRQGQRNYLTYSVLGGLMAQGEVVQNRETKVFSKAKANR